MIVLERALKQHLASYMLSAVLKVKKKLCSYGCLSAPVDKTSNSTYDSLNETTVGLKFWYAWLSIYVCTEPFLTLKDTKLCKCSYYVWQIQM